MKRLVIVLGLTLSTFIACKPEHPDLKTAFELFKEAQDHKQTIITMNAQLKDEAKAVDSRIRNEDKESVFAISEVYNHLDQVDAGLKKLAPRERSVPGHEKESKGISPLDPKMNPSDILMLQKNYRDSLLLVKNDLTAAGTLLGHLKSKFN